MSGTPFTKEFVIRTTINHMLESINISIKKTIRRLKEFEGDEAKMQEAMDALGSLTALNNMMVDVKNNNRELIEEYKDDNDY